ncbi:MAG: hypothetical protein P0Y56_00870 [Candidatus Andeanibacterium colombiense]|uniref:Uncharacterized protein n=1 Tax=Candidatus Andeanibacterium colombiense TaxID=3121345 RepID=A0AAJ6BMW8_9SPHN|nr:MAG: hypothetical protein P0Y56_00870 [Sphingomonadaceae bacterium]
MEFSNFADHTPASRRNGWSPELKIKFLDHLAAKGNVRAACSCAGMSHEAAYRLRRRDVLFARGWNAALGLARQNSADVLSCRAIDGIVEDVWYRGEFVGTRIRHDSRLLLAHLARLDRLVEGARTRQDTGRFDEILALILEEEVPEEVGEDYGELPPDRTSFIASAERQAKIECRWAWPDREEDEDAEPLTAEEQWEADEDRRIEVEEACDDAAHGASLEAAALWDEWFRRACGRVDEVLGGAEFAVGTVSTVSTSVDPAEDSTHDPARDSEPHSRHPELVSGTIGPEARRYEAGKDEAGQAGSSHNDQGKSGDGS